MSDAARDDGRLVPLATGAEARLTGPTDGPPIVCLNGGTARPLPGTWGASIAWLVARLGAAMPERRFIEVRYRTRSWRRLRPCVEDALAAIDFAGAGPVTLLGYSMGGAVSIATAPLAPSVEHVIGLAPWIPDDFEVSALRGVRLDVFHGTLDAWIPGVPGVSPRNSLGGVKRARAAGVEAHHTMIAGALHAVAFSGPGGLLIRAPRAARWAELCERALREVAAEDR